MARLPDKVDRYMSLFRGREDVYAHRWENRRKGISGYSPTVARKLQKRGWIVGNDGKVRGWWFSLPERAITFRSASNVARQPMQTHGFRGKPASGGVQSPVSGGSA